MSEEEEFKNGDTLSFFYWLSWRPPIFGANIFQKFGLVISQGHPTSIFGNICSEDDLRSRIFQTFVVKFLACL